ILSTLLMIIIVTLYPLMSLLLLLIHAPTSYSFSFFFNDPATTEIYTLSLHDALPISGSWKTGALSPSDRGSVITPFKADAAASSGLHKNTLSSRVPDLPGKFLGVVRKLFRPLAGACPIPIQPLQPASCIVPPDSTKLAI